MWPFDGVVLLVVGLKRNTSGTADAAKRDLASAP